MLPTATHNAHDNTTEAVLFMTFELRENTWRRGFSLGHGHKPLLRRHLGSHPAEHLSDTRQRTRFS